MPSDRQWLLGAVNGVELSAQVRPLHQSLIQPLGRSDS
jgi:hypothetical protein